MTEETIQGCNQRIKELNHENIELHKKLHRLSQKIELNRASILVEKSKIEKKNYTNSIVMIIFFISLSFFFIFKK